MFGFDDLAVAGLLATLAGTAIQYNSSRQAARRAQEASMAAMQRQNEYQRQAAEAAAKRAQEYKAEDRGKEQEEIVSDLEQTYLKPTLSAQEINADAATTQGDVSDDYKAAKAKSDANVDSLAKTFANLIAKSQAASQLRVNEGYKNADAASRIGLLKNFAQGTGAVDQMKIQNAANSGASGQFLGGLLGAAGSAATMYGITNPGALDSLFNKGTLIGLKDPTGFGGYTTVGFKGSPSLLAPKLG